MREYTCSNSVFFCTTFAVLHEVEYDPMRSLMNGVCCALASCVEVSNSMTSAYVENFRANETLGTSEQLLNAVESLVETALRL